MQIAGKKFKRSSSRTCKNIKNDIKALRPQVYITDICSFKSLVQELTGNINGPTLLPLPPRETQQQPLFADIEDHHGNERTISADPIIDPNHEEIMNNQTWIDQDDHIYVDVSASMNQYEDFLTVVESWLLGVEPCLSQKESDLYL